MYFPLMMTTMCIVWRNGQLFDKPYRVVYSDSLQNPQFTCFTHTALAYFDITEGHYLLNIGFLVSTQMPNFPQLIIPATFILFL